MGNPMTGQHWQSQLLGSAACGALPGPGESPPAAKPELIGCLRCAVAVKSALRKARERNYFGAGPDSALLLQEGRLDPATLWKHRYGPAEQPGVKEVPIQSYEANCRAEEALDTALYVMGLDPERAQRRALRAYRNHLADYAATLEYYSHITGPIPLQISNAAPLNPTAPAAAGQEQKS